MTAELSTHKKRVAALAARLVAGAIAELGPLSDAEFEARLEELMPQAIRDARAAISAAEEFLT